MDRLTIAHRALATLEEILREPPGPIVRDATIQRFEYTAEAVWKAARAWLHDHASIDEAHPRGCYRALFRAGRIDETLALALMVSVEDRNRTSHAYVEAVATAVHARIPDHARAFRALLDALARPEE